MKTSFVINKYLSVNIIMCRYEGNNFLCLATNASCSSIPPFSSTPKNNTPLIIGIVCGALVVLIVIIVLCMFVWKRRQTPQQSTSHEKTSQLNTTKTDYLDHGNDYVFTSMSIYINS